MICRFAGARHCGDTSYEQDRIVMVAQVVTKTQDVTAGSASHSRAAPWGWPPQISATYPGAVAELVLAGDGGVVGDDGGGAGFGGGGVVGGELVEVADGGAGEGLGGGVEAGDGQVEC